MSLVSSGAPVWDEFEQFAADDGAMTDVLTGSSGGGDQHHHHQHHQGLSRDASAPGTFLAGSGHIAPLGYLLLQQAVERAPQCDLTVLVGRDLVPFGFHSCVFVARSPVLRVMLASGMRESVAGDGGKFEVRFPTLSVDCFHALRRFMYTGALHIPPFAMEELIHFCDAYNIEGASYLLADVLAETLTVQSCAFALHTASEHANLSRLRAVSLQFACDHLEQVLATHSPYLNTQRVVELVAHVGSNEFVPPSVAWVSAAHWITQAELAPARSAPPSDDGADDAVLGDNDDDDDDDDEDGDDGNNGDLKPAQPAADGASDDARTRANLLFAVLKFDRLNSDFMRQLISAKDDEPLSVFRRYVADFRDVWSQQAVLLLALQEKVHKESKWFASAPFGDDYQVTHQFSDTLQRSISFHSLVAHSNWSHEEMRLSAYNGLPQYQKQTARISQRLARSNRRHQRIVHGAPDGGAATPTAPAAATATAAAASTSAAPATPSATDAAATPPSSSSSTRLRHHRSSGSEASSRLQQQQQQQAHVSPQHRLQQQQQVQQGMPVPTPTASPSASASASAYAPLPETDSSGEEEPE